MKIKSKEIQIHEQKGFMNDIECLCIVYHPAIGSNKWQELFSVWRQTTDHGNGYELALITQQLFGTCWTRANQFKEGNK